jgi:flagellin-like protein
MKGITPIISIIILLLITVGLAAAAWTYMGNYLTTLTAKVIEIPTQKCVTGTDGQDVMTIIHNIGTSKINIDNDVIILDNQGNAVIGDWTEIADSTTVTEIDSGGYSKAIVDCCGGAGEDKCPKTCTFDFILAGRSQTVTVYCPGA